MVSWDGGIVSLFTRASCTEALLLPMIDGDTESYFIFR